MSLLSVLVSTISPFPSLTVSVPPESQISDLHASLSSRYPTLPAESLVLSTHSGVIPDSDAPLSSLLRADEDESTLLTLRLAPRVLGGKGGFGSQLRAAGGRMSSQRTSNNDSCRDLNGRRLSTIKEAKRLAEYLEAEPQRTAEKAEAQKKKLEALEKKLGIERPASGGAEAGPSSGPSKIQDDPAHFAGKKHRLDDSEYIEQSRDLVDGVKNAVSAALLKKKKKAKLTHPTADPVKDVTSEKVAEKASVTPIAAVGA